FLPSGVAACNDFEGISPWADDSLYWAAGIGLLAWGADGRPEPQGTLSPEELEQALARFFDRPVPAVPYLLEHW
ncbi:S-layer homology domain-containing protein, partial [Odoribacter splanchnicus]|nr:S-layer homology domain-containing protein [Odoribacter splanchnicus]